MKQEYTHTKVKTILRKERKAEKWRILIEASPVYNEDFEPTIVTEDPGIFVTTPLFEDIPLRVCTDGTKIYPVKRDSEGIIMCRSKIDKAACLYAEQIRKIRQSEYDKEKLYTKEEQRIIAKFEHGEEDFIAYFEEGISRFHPQCSDSALSNWKRTLELFKRFTKNRPIAFKQLDTRLCNDFKYYLLSTTKEVNHNGKGNLSAGTVAQYLSVFKAVLKQAFVEDYLPMNLAAQLQGITAPRSKRDTLDMEALSLLSRTACPRPIVKRAALFTALSGLRHCDVKAIKWKEIKNASDGWRLEFTQQKTGVPAYIPITDQAYQLLGEKGKAEDVIFKGLPAVSECNRAIVKWVENAGLERHITYHCFRHSFATLLLERGVNLFTIKSLMGHTRVTTTEVYSHIVDKAKVQATKAIKLPATKAKSAKSKK